MIISLHKDIAHHIFWTLSIMIDYVPLNGDGPVFVLTSEGGLGL